MHGFAKASKAASEGEPTALARVSETHLCWKTEDLSLAANVSVSPYLLPPSRCFSMFTVDKNTVGVRNAILLTFFRIGHNSSNLRIAEYAYISVDLNRM